MPADEDHELDDIADELYGLRPDEFSAARDARIKQARGEGKQALARELGRLRKPTLSAWLINLLWRDQRDVIEQLFELAGELSQAQAEASGPLLRALMSQRREVETALMRRAATLAEDAGVNVSESVIREAQETLNAAMAQPEVAEEVRTGRLVKPAEYAGFGVPPASPRAPRRAPPAEPVDLQAAQRAREATQHRRAAEQRVRTAREALEVADASLAERKRRAQVAHERHDALLRQLEEARDRVKHLEEEAAAAESSLREADAGRARAQQQRDEAQAAIQQATQALAEL